MLVAIFSILIIFALKHYNDDNELSLGLLMFHIPNIHGFCLLKSAKLFEIEVNIYN